jgi:hypothetical protein
MMKVYVLITDLEWLRRPNDPYCIVLRMALLDRQGRRGEKFVAVAFDPVL